MEVSFKVEGLDRIQYATEAVRKSIAAELVRAMQASVSRVDQEAKRSITRGPKTGRIYRIRSVLHQASDPGEAPASQTGLLVNSIRGHVDRQALSNGQLEGKVSVGVDYGRVLEFGRLLEFGTTKKTARPFLHPAFEKSKAWISERFNKAVVDGLLKATKK